MRSAWPTQHEVDEDSDLTLPIGPIPALLDPMRLDPPSDSSANAGEHPPRHQEAWKEAKPQSCQLHCGGLKRSFPGGIGSVKRCSPLSQAISSASEGDMAAAELIGNALVPPAPLVEVVEVPEVDPPVGIRLVDI